MRPVPLALSPLLLVATLLVSGSPLAWAAHGAEDPAKPQPVRTQAEKAAARFPQPVRVGDLIGRQVIEPSDRQHSLGRVDGIVRRPDGAVLMVVRYGGLLGFATRPIAVPIETLALAGKMVEIVDLSQPELDALPDWTGTGAARIGPDEKIAIGLTRN